MPNGTKEEKRKRKLDAITRGRDPDLGCGSSWQQNQARNQVGSPSRDSYGGPQAIEEGSLQQCSTTSRSISTGTAANCTPGHAHGPDRSPFDAGNAEPPRGLINTKAAPTCILKIPHNPTAKSLMSRAGQGARIGRIGRNLGSHVDAMACL